MAVNGEPKVDGEPSLAQRHIPQQCATRQSVTDLTSLRLSVGDYNISNHVQNQVFYQRRTWQRWIRRCVFAQRRRWTQGKAKWLTIFD